MNHHIQRQQFILTILQGIDAFAAQHAGSRWLRQGLLPALERIFDELSGEDEVIRLDHIVIDLGVIPEAVLESGVVDDAMYRLLKQEFRAALERELSLRPDAISRAAEGVMQRWWYYMEHGRLPWNADNLSEDDYRRVLELFSVDFVQITRLRNALTEGSTFLTRVVAQHNGWFLENLVTVLVSSRQDGLAQSVTRAVEAHSLLEAIYRQHTAAEKQQAPEAVETPQQIGQREDLRRWANQTTTFRQEPVHEKRAILWRRLLVLAAQHRELFIRVGGVQILVRDIPESLMEMLVREFRGGDDPFLQALRRIAERQHRDKTLDVGRLQPMANRPEDRIDEGTPPAADTRADAGSIQESTAGGTGGTENRDRPPKDDRTETRSGEKPRASLSAEEPRRTGEEPATAKLSRPGTTGAEPEIIASPEQLFPSALSLPTVAPSPQGDQPKPAPAKRPMQDETQFHREQVTEEGIYLSNAGLVLLHPFLSTLFHRLHLWDGGGFASLEARQKAIFLLHFLATAERTAPEYALVFPKMICGYALEMPVPAEMALTDEECDEALVLLDNVILRWDKLGNTSPQGLREGFLQRRGKLFDKGGRLSLLMESSAVDVLLDYLPWNIHLVKLPWLKDILYVDWR